MPIFTHAWNMLLYENFAALEMIEAEFGTYEEAWKRMSYKEIDRLPISDGQKTHIQGAIRSIEPEKLYEKLGAMGIQTTSPNQSDYPELLKQIHQIPPILYYKGSLESLKKTCLAVVGTRSNSIYGKQCTERITSDLISQNVTIVSGLARGIDGIAHAEALKNNGHTVAVLAHGFRYMSPSCHRSLAKSIVESGGLLISEFPPEAPPLKHHFIRRNRIISGLSNGVVIIECPYRSGAMNTAYHALDQNREVFALPGDITREQALGPIKLLKVPQAKIITSAKDVVEGLGLEWKKQNSAEKIECTKEEAQLLKAIPANTVISMQEIAEVSGQPIQLLSKNLTKLEIQGLIKREGFGYISQQY